MRSPPKLHQENDDWKFTTVESAIAGEMSMRDPDRTEGSVRKFKSWPDHSMWRRRRDLLAELGGGMAWGDRLMQMGRCPPLLAGVLRQAGRLPSLRGGVHDTGRVGVARIF